jgi:hypothetical protein
MQAYIEGESTCRVGSLMIRMGGAGLGKPEVSRICVQFDAEVADLAEPFMNYADSGSKLPSDTRCAMS